MASGRTDRQISSTSISIISSSSRITPSTSSLVCSSCSRSGCNSSSCCSIRYSRHSAAEDSGDNKGLSEKRDSGEKERSQDALKEGQPRPGSDPEADAQCEKVGKGSKMNYEEFVGDCKDEDEKVEERVDAKDGCEGHLHSLNAADEDSGDDTGLSEKRDSDEKGKSQDALKDDQPRFGSNPEADAEDECEEFVQDSKDEERKVKDHVDTKIGFDGYLHSIRSAVDDSGGRKGPSVKLDSDEKETARSTTRSSGRTPRTRTRRRRNASTSRTGSKAIFILRIRR